jgi:hypothetical protein
MARSGTDADGGFDDLVDRLRHELGAEALDVPPPPPPAPPPNALGRARTRATVATWRVRAAVPESMKAPFRRLLGRPSPAQLAEPEQPSDLARSVEELQVLQLELARRVSELEERLGASGAAEKGQAKTPSSKR